MKRLRLKKRRVSKKETLEAKLRRLFEMDRLYTIEDLVVLTGAKRPYLQSKISMMQNSDYTTSPIRIKRVRCADSVRRIGKEGAIKICDINLD